MADIVNKVHVSPGVYATETVDMKAAANSIGITKLAVVGETLKGPAFQPYWIHSPKEYASVFGGTSTEKFKESNYPKYELPYIANEYLKAGTELCVVKTLGFSGYNAGPAWVITGEKEGVEGKIAIAVLRSRGSYKYNPNFAQKVDANQCECNNGNDVITFDVGEKLNYVGCDDPISYNMNAVSLSTYSSLMTNNDGCYDYKLSGKEGGFSASATNLGKFTINCIVGPSENSVDSPGPKDNVMHFSVSLNPQDSDYILNVLGTSNSNGDAPLYVETLYDVAWKYYVENGGYNKVSQNLSKYNVSYASDYGGLLPVDGFLKKNENDLKRNDLGKRYLCNPRVYDVSKIYFSEFDYATNLPNGKGGNVAAGCIYTVKQITDSVTGQRKFVYSSYSQESTENLSGDEKIMAQDMLVNTKDEMSKRGSIVYNNEDGLYYRMEDKYSYLSTENPNSVKYSDVGYVTNSASTWAISTNFSGETLYAIEDNNGAGEVELYKVDYSEERLRYEVQENYMNSDQQPGLYVISGETYLSYKINTSNDFKLSELSAATSATTMHQIVLNGIPYDEEVSSFTIYLSKRQINTVDDVANNLSEPISGNAVSELFVGRINGTPGENSVLSACTFEEGYNYIYVPTKYIHTDTKYSCSESVCKVYNNKSCEPKFYPVRLSAYAGNMHGTTIKVEKNTDGYWPIENKWAFGSGSMRFYQLAYSDSAVTIDLYNSYNESAHIGAVTCDFNDYKSAYRYSSTPWVVSNIKGDANNIELNRMFRFHTISDGAASLTEVKISIENIRPDSGEFDVVVRKYTDTDSNPVILEAFRRCTMASGKNSVAYKIGTIDGSYESKSRYITVEIYDGFAAENSVPCGFLGYSMPIYDGIPISYKRNENIKLAPITYNKSYIQDISKKRQYFGLSDISGYDVDYFTFKGNMSTLEDPNFVTHGFHLDSRVDIKSYNGMAPTLTVDGIEGYEFDTVGINERTKTEKNTPIIDSEVNMRGSIFEDVKLRKFTLLFAGGFDGWDEYRGERTNTNEYSYTNYKGSFNNQVGSGRNFKTMADAYTYDIEGNALNTDYYSTLAGVSLLKNPEETDINLLATPGIDTINNSQLIGEIFNIIEDRADTFYIVTTPDRYAGDSDYIDDIPDTDDIVDDFLYNELYSDNAATYYPWVKIEDNGKYIWLPPTKDVVRNLAESDNTNTTMNLAPAGTSRGKVNAIKARKNLKNAESDTLYDANINPVRTYAQNGLVIMGQKTLRKEDDLMNRVDVRRMVLRMRKLISIACLGLIFEPYDNATVRAFRTIISGIMQVFIDNRAVEKWSMDVDDSQEMRDRLELSAVIYIKPIRALEYITLNFVVTNNDVYFEG